VLFITKHNLGCQAVRLILGVSMSYTDREKEAVGSCFRNTGEGKERPAFQFNRVRFNLCY